MQAAVAWVLVLVILIGLFMDWAVSIYPFYYMIFVFID